MTRRHRKLQAMQDQLEQIDRLTASGEVFYTPELDSAMAQLREEIAALSEELGVETAHD
jgi:hypothetical protein